MAKEIVGNIPEFTKDEPLDEAKEVKPEEKETPAEPSTVEKPAEETSAISEDVKTPEEEISEDTGETKAVQGLREEREKLLAEIRELRGDRRNLRTQASEKVETEAIDDLKDVDEASRSIINRIIKAGGYLTKEELDKKVFAETKQGALDAFLDKYPEYKPENDPNDINWSALQRELKDYVLPPTKSGIARVLEKARKNVLIPSSSDRTAIQASEQRLKTAGAGTKGGITRSSVSESLTPEQREAYKRGGWSEEEITQIEKKLK